MPRVRKQLGAGHFHQSPGHAVVVDMSVGDDDSRDIVERVAAGVERVSKCGQPVVGLAGVPHAAVHQGHGVAGFNDAVARLYVQVVSVDRFLSLPLTILGVTQSVCRMFRKLPPLPYAINL